MRAPARPKTLPREVRIIGGQFKRSKLPVADKPGLRPTPDRVRETLFNWLAHLAGAEMTGWRCVDAFAGTGALGFEAASRGAAHVLLVEQDPALVAQLKATQTKLQATTVQVVRGDGLSVLRSLPAAQTRLVFLDPPFDAPVFDAALKAVATTLAPDGWVYLEAPKAWSDEALAEYGLAVYRHLKAGAVHAHLLQRAS
ncbi:MAG: hypothetical protein RL459_2321 [Pseudomonadota bacterium]|jgi:16S rRNA (guanine(966)-N(2))-methyltransferase RsmD